MSKTLKNKGFCVKLPIVNLEYPCKLTKPVVMIPEEDYKNLLEDISDLRSALKAEEESVVGEGKLFSDYDKQRRKKR